MIRKLEVETKYPRIEEDLPFDETEKSPYKDYDEYVDSDEMSAGEAGFLRGYSEMDVG